MQLNKLTLVILIFFPSIILNAQDSVRLYHIFYGENDQDQFGIVAQDWKYLGLGTKVINSIAVDWYNHNILYAGSGSNFSSGDLGGIFKSIDGGFNWDTLISGVTVHTIVIHPLNSDIIYATLGLNVLTAAGVIKTTDGGRNWKKADNGIKVTWEEGPGPLVINPKHPDTLYCGTGGPFGGKFYKSTNGGLNWYSLGDTTALEDGVTALAVHPDSTNVVYAGTAFSGNVLKSSNEGIDWQSTGLQAGIITIEFDRKGVTTYAGGYWTNRWPAGIFRTTDGGVSWENPKMGLPDSLNIQKIQILSYSEGNIFFIAANWGDSGSVYQSLNGYEWEKIGINNGQVSTITLSERKLYAGCGGVYVLDIPTSISDDASFLPSNIKLYENFPNPFNSGTHLTYEIATNSKVLLEIFDIHGRKIKTLVRKDQSPGKHTIYWNGQDEKGNLVSSGVYINVLRIERQIVVKKMIHLK
ncbi:MAG: T9SS type A sorting domain-containing protein [Ignavibacteria bacterium]|nr:T9SS type A sorting domain-containing protein [Ignavibacteria bacterium]OIO20332.1 MAG: hypothetical protein AUJ54_05600 [Ignavibacteria bacterium CG1_02_37_35]PIS44533.1 MAG: hypothetical protein COT22_10030 [Ignavibacteria bacterium CG08_land_8_20_14_0_20_37_9]PIX94455.1 MAG: hypothetical protein COZ25_05455 [Ignavibacteria bacterium CG_4_10_14_3_um_filter_37_18]PJC57823.1 MAG: hypothetical protein CO025_11400 [Ignavibacteria bacterium CG_4_9_14_0_2_um_filter_37_13]